MVELEDRLRLITTIYSLLPDTERWGLIVPQLVPENIQCFPQLFHTEKEKNFRDNPRIELWYVWLQIVCVFVINHSVVKIMDTLFKSLCSAVCKSLEPRKLIHFKNSLIEMGNLFINF